MKLSGRIKFFFGIIIVFAIVALLTFILNITMSTSHSVQAELSAQARSIGTDYAGLVVKQNVEEGQKITKDQVLFEIDSQQLKQALAAGLVKEKDLPFTLTSDTQDIQLRATSDGVMSTISYREGSFVPAGGVVASAYVVDSLFVVAHFKLSPPDYARIEQDTPIEVLFPDNTKKQASITSVNLESSSDKQNVDTVIKAKISDVDMSDFRFSVGTPVNATLHLKQNPWYENTVNFVQGLFTPQKG